MRGDHEQLSSYKMLHVYCFYHCYTIATCEVLMNQVLGTLVLLLLSQQLVASTHTKTIQAKAPQLAALTTPYQG